MEVQKKGMEGLMMASQRRVIENNQKQKQRKRNKKKEKEREGGEREWEGVLGVG
jgi:hypothetical protein